MGLNLLIALESALKDWHFTLILVDQVASVLESVVVVGLNAHLFQDPILSLYVKVVVVKM